MDYLDLNLGLDSLDLGMSLEEINHLIYPETCELLEEHLNHYEIMRFMNRSYRRKNRLRDAFIKDNLYSLILLIIAYLLSWFFLKNFSVSIGSMMASFDVDLSMIKYYQMIVQSGLFGIHLIVAMCFFLGIIFFQKDLSVLMFIRFHQKIGFSRRLTSYNFAENMLLFIQYGIKTQLLMKVMRKASTDTFSRWLSYHVEDHLFMGNDFSISINQSYFDPKLVLVLQEGMRNGNLELSLKRYLSHADKYLMKDSKVFSSVSKAIVFVYLIILMAIFYSVLYLPMQVMEVL